LRSLSQDASKIEQRLVTARQPIYQLRVECRVLHSGQREPAGMDCDQHGCAASNDVAGRSRIRPDRSRASLTAFVREGTIRETAFKVQ